MVQASVSEILRKMSRLNKLMNFVINCTNWFFLLPDAVQNIPVGMNPDVHVGHYEIVELALLLIRKEQIRHPHPGGVRQRQVA